MSCKVGHYTLGKWYAVYRGDEYITSGTLNSIAAELGVKPQTILFYSYPGYLKRIEPEYENRLLAIRVDD